MPRRWWHRKQGQGPEPCCFASMRSSVEPFACCSLCHIQKTGGTRKFWPCLPTLLTLDSNKTSHISTSDPIIINRQQEGRNISETEIQAAKVLCNTMGYHQMSLYQQPVHKTKHTHLHTAHSCPCIGLIHAIVGSPYTHSTYKMVSFLRRGEYSFFT